MSNNTLSYMTKDDGDLKISWDPTKPVEVEAARSTFDKLKKDGYAAFKMELGGKQGEQIREFSPDVEHILMTPPMQAG